MNATRRGMLWVIAFVILWEVLERIAGWLSRPYSPYQVVWSRYGSHLAIMLAVWGWREPLALVRTGKPALQVARSLLMLVMPVAWIVALQHGLTQNNLLAMFGMAPLVICVLAAVLLRERPTVGIWVSAAIVSTGAMCCLSFQGRPSLIAMSAALTAAGSFSLYMVMTRMLRGEELRANLFYTALGVFAALSFFMPSVWITPTPPDAGVMVLIGAFGLLALFALDRTTQTAPVSSAGAVVDARLLVLIGGVLVGQHPDLRIQIGVATVAMGTICALSLGCDPSGGGQ